MSEIQLNPKLAVRKNELTNTIEVIRQLAVVPLDSVMTTGQINATLKDRIAALDTASGTQGQDTNALVARFLEAVNTLTGHSYTVSDLRSGAVTVTALTDAIQGSLLNKKVVIYQPVSVGVIGALAYSAADITPFMSDLDGSMWEEIGYHTSFPVPSPSASYDEKVRVDVLVASDHLPVVDDNGNHVVGFINTFNAAANLVGIKLGYLNQAGTFVESPLPVAYQNENFVLTVPLKSNLFVLPVDGLALTRRDGWMGVRQSDLQAINNKLTHNGITGTSNIPEVIGIDPLTSAALQAATVSEFAPAGFANAIEALNAIFAAMQDVQETLGNHTSGLHAHPANRIDFTPFGSIQVTDVQAAIQQVVGVADGASAAANAANNTANNAQGAVTALSGTVATGRGDVAHLKDDVNNNDAKLQLQLLSAAYSMVTVDSFVVAGSNGYIGPDAAVINVDGMKLTHSGNNANPVGIYTQQVIGDVSGKTKVSMKRMLVPSAQAGTDYFVDFYVEINGARYISALVYKLLHFTPANFVALNSEMLQEFDLSALTPETGSSAPQHPLLVAGDTVTLKIKIGLDSAGLSKTPAVDYFQLFV